MKIIAMADEYKKRIADAKGSVDWDKVLHQFQEWRATASRMAPWIQDIVSRYDAILHEAGAR